MDHWKMSALLFQQSPLLKHFNNQLLPDELIQKNKFNNVRVSELVYQPWLAKGNPDISSFMIYSMCQKVKRISKLTRVETVK